MLSLGAQGQEGTSTNTATQTLTMLSYTHSVHFTFHVSTYVCIHVRILFCVESSLYLRIMLLFLRWRCSPVYYFYIICSILSLDLSTKFTCTNSVYTCMYYGGVHMFTTFWDKRMYSIISYPQIREETCDWQRSYRVYYTQNTCPNFRAFRQNHNSRGLCSNTLWCSTHSACDERSLSLLCISSSS